LGDLKLGLGDSIDICIIMIVRKYGEMIVIVTIMIY